MEKLTKRSARGERAYAVQLIVDRSSILEAKFRGASIGSKEKDSIWQEMASDLNASGHASWLRTSGEIKKDVGNMKSRAKDKHDSNFKTGGGATSTFTPTEEIIISHLLANNKSKLKGIETGIDSLSDQTDDSCTVPSTDVIVRDVFIGNNLIDRNNNNVHVIVDDDGRTSLAGCNGDGKAAQTETKKKILYEAKENIITCKGRQRG